MPVSNEIEFWSVGKSKWNRWQVRKASVETPDEYELIEDLGPVKKLDPETGDLYEPLRDVGIEFDGVFYLSRIDTVVRFLAEDAPWLFVVTCDGSLYVKRVREDLSTAVKLATNVEKASLCRLWRNDYYDTNQGLLLVYLKSDKHAYYRNYRKLDNQWVWDSETLLAEGIVTGLKVFRLNDFRSCVFLEGLNKLYITGRYYIGNTVKDEGIGVHFSHDFRLLANRYLCEEPPDLLQAVSCRFLSSTVVDTEFNFPVFEYRSGWDDITWTGNLPAGQSISELEFNGKHLLIHLAIPMNNPRMALSFKCRATNMKGYYVSDNAKPLWPELTWGKVQEPIVVEPVQNQGEVAADVLTEFVSFNAVEKKVYNENYLESPIVNVNSSFVSFNNPQKRVYRAECQDQMSPALTTLFIDFDCEMTGVSPV